MTPGDMTPGDVMSSAPTAPGALLDEARLSPDGSGRLAGVRRMIEDGAVSVLSLDMFDTIVWRRVPRPTDAFVLLGVELAEADMLDRQLRPAAFRRLRIEAEERARQVRKANGDGVEVTLEEIWSHVPLHVRNFLPVEPFVEREIELERLVTYPDLDIVDLAELAAARSCRLAIVSNTYFSGQQLARLIARPEMEALRQAQIFTSSKFGVGKADGLWKIVIEELDVPADRIVHVGDEHASDVEAPGELGVHTVHFRRVDDKTRKVLELEGALPETPVGPSDVVVDARSGDYGLTGLRAKVSGRSDGLGLSADQATAWRFGATVLGPVLTGFADWVHDRAVELGATTAWCMMREGELLADLVGRMGTDRHSGIKGQPVWLSRHVTAKATLTTGEPDELRKLLNRRLVPTVAEYLANLGLKTGEVPEFRHCAAERMDQPGLAAEVVDTLGTNKHLRRRIVAESTATRARLVNYLAPVLSEAGDVTILVDLGWGGTIQRQLVDVLRLSGINRRIVGMYLATNELATAKLLDGVEIAGYLIDGGEPRQAIVEIGRSPEIIEQSCLASCGSVSDFTDEGEPILDSFSAPPEQVTSKIAVQQGVRAFQREWLRYDRGVEGFARLDGGERPQLLEILRRSVSNPTPEEAATFGAWTHDDNFGVDKRERVIPDRLAAYVPYLSPPDLLEMTMQDAFWPLGLAAEYDGGLAAATRAVLAGRMSKEDFESRRTPSAVEVSVDSGRGWSGHQQRPLRVNPNGLSYAHFDLRADAITSVRLDPCDHLAVFRIDWIDLGLRVRGQSEPVRSTLAGSDDLSALVYSGCRWLYDGVGIGFGDDPQIHIPIAHRAAGEIYGVELTVAMAVMTLPASRSAVELHRSDFGTSWAWAMGKIRNEAATGGPSAVGRGALRMAKRRLGA